LIECERWYWLEEASAISLFIPHNNYGHHDDVSTKHQMQQLRDNAAERERERVCVRPYILSYEQMLSCKQLSSEGGRDRCIELPSGIEHHRVLLHLKQTKISICIVFALTGLNVCFGRFKLCKSNAKHASLGRRIALRFEGALSSTVTTSTTSTQTIST
jgi:hypothetical protein